MRNLPLAFALTLAADTHAGLNCTTDLDLGPALSVARKGLGLDDNTLNLCAADIPYIWPNTAQPITSFRTYNGLRNLNATQRSEAFSNLAATVRASGARVLVGTQITCFQADDDEDWGYVKELLHMLGPQHVMGLAVGNEIDILTFQPWWKYMPKKCIYTIWGSYYFDTFRRRVSDFDAIPGFDGLPVTTGFNIYTFDADNASDTFIDEPEAASLSLIRNLTREYGPRFVFMFNLYAYFDNDGWPDFFSSKKCSYAVDSGVCYQCPTCWISVKVSSIRQRMRTFLNRNDGVLWIGEIGWSWPLAQSNKAWTTDCAEFDSEETALRQYRNFLDWELNATGNEMMPDHVFYFTAHDSAIDARSEHFGLIGQCGDKACKFQQSNASEKLKLRKPDESCPSEYGPKPQWYGFYLFWAFLLLWALFWTARKCVSDRWRRDGGREALLSN